MTSTLGKNGEELHSWIVATRVFKRMQKSAEAGSSGVDNAFAERSMENLCTGAQVHRCTGAQVHRWA